MMALEGKTKKMISNDCGRGKRDVAVVTTPLTRDEAREMFPYRPYSKYAETKWGGNTLVDDVALILGGDAARCGMCKAPTRKKYLLEGVCPDCDGRAEYAEDNPRASSS